MCPFHHIISTLPLHLSVSLSLSLLSPPLYHLHSSTLSGLYHTTIIHQSLLSLKPQTKPNPTAKMRLTPLLLAALTTYTTAQDLNALTSSVGSYLQTADPTSVVNSLNSYAAAQLHSLSKIAATATGDLGSSLKSEYSSLKTELSAARSSESSLLNSATSAASSAVSAASSAASSASSAGEGSANGGVPAATGVPVAMGAVGMAVLAML